MEALDILVKTTKDASYLALHHPILSVFGSLVLFIVMIRFYCRLTVGIYEGDEDMTGKTVVITGASAGIGKSTAFDLAKRNARVILACRDKAKAQGVADEIKAATGNDKVVVKTLDLCSFQSVRKCAKELLESEDKIDVLINNAGITESTVKTTEDGHETVMQSNHLGPFLFTLLLIDLMKKSAPSRIVNVSSGAHAFANMDLNDLEKKSGKLQVYAVTKLANVLFTIELARRLAGTGVTVNSLHPGTVRTDIFKAASGFFLWSTFFVVYLFGKNSEEGAQSTIRLAVDPVLSTTTGKYFSDCKENATRGCVLNKNGVWIDLAKDGNEECAKSLFEISEKIVGVAFPPPST